jgi:hypothetical protein
MGRWRNRLASRDTSRWPRRCSALGENLVAEQEDRGQTQPTADDDGGHQDHAVELVVVEDVTSNRPNNTRATPVLRNVCTRLRTALVLRLRPMNVRDANPKTNVSAAAPRSNHPTVVCEIDTLHPGVSDTSGQPIGRGDRAACARCTRCGNCRAPAAAAPPGPRSRPARVGSGEAPG